ncbi:MAG: non-hydrolyzing UDP-N-acetylglucosamine 2-epimerase [Acidobacteriota bacterium]
MKIALVAGARPNFMKIAPLVWAMSNRPELTPFIIHTGQHYDDNMSRVFFDELELPDPDVDLGVGSATHAVQTARVMTAIEPVLEDECPDWVLVVGDVNSTLAAALVVVKLGIPVGHVEAGLRSGDRTMPEETNRLATDAISTLLFAPSHDAVDNLRREGHPEEHIAFVGNVMVDTLLKLLPRIDACHRRADLGIRADYVLVTLHRPSNVDSDDMLSDYLDALCEIAADWQVVFPVHPRTRPHIDRLLAPRLRPGGLRLLPPVSYLDFIALEDGARLVITDSGGVQEETTVLGVPCLTVRTTTERPVTVTEGTNRLIGASASRLLYHARRIKTTPPRSARPSLWDGNAATRILSVLQQPRRHRKESHRIRQPHGVRRDSGRATEIRNSADRAP